MYVHARRSMDWWTAPAFSVGRGCGCGDALPLVAGILQDVAALPSSGRTCAGPSSAGRHSHPECLVGLARRGWAQRAHHCFRRPDTAPRDAVAFVRLNLTLDCATVHRAGTCHAMRPSSTRAPHAMLRISDKVPPVRISRGTTAARGTPQRLYTIPTDAAHARPQQGRSCSCQGVPMQRTHASAPHR